MDMKKINVCFAIHVYSFVQTSHIGEISITQLNRLLSTLYKSKPTDNSCIRKMVIQYTNKITSYPMREGQEKIAPSPQLEIIDTFWQYGNRPCTNKSLENMTDIQCMGNCAKNLREGKCQDEYIRKTLGAIIFPQFYAKGKQNAK